MTHLDLRNKYFSFWVAKPRSSVQIPSSSLVPENDPTTLFTGSGMQPLIPYLLGQPHPLGTRLVDIQKCFRGQDIDEVGDNRHDSFFEMMGNWSLGDYFKEEQLTWFWEFLTKDLGLASGKLHVTCFAGSKDAPRDEESALIWKQIGIPEERIHFYDVKKNWWSRSGSPDQMPPGEIGGPDSEMFYEFSDRPHDVAFGKECHVNCDCGRFGEIGNSVFIQYQKQEDGSFKELKQKNVDFGGGVERMLAAVNNDPDIFRTSVFSEIILMLQKVSGIEYGEKEELNRSFRIIADHVRSATFLINEGVLPSNVDRGYILRRLLRRAIRYSKNLNMEENFIEKVVDPVAKTYEDVYPELEENKTKIKEVISREETKFRNTLSKGLKEFDKMSKKGELNIIDATLLYQSFGFPYEITIEEASLRNLPTVNINPTAIANVTIAHQDASRSASQGKFKGGLADQSETVVKYHTATHLLQAALRKVLGESVHQEGSNITGERLRFDFSFDRKITEDELKKITELVNDWISQGLERKVETLKYEEAIASGAMAFFKERYPNKVTVYSFGVVSKEICGGPHVENTKNMGMFKIIKEESISAGVRRIYGVLE